MADNLMYNGIPLFIVDFADFAYVLECTDANKRMLARNIQCESLKDYFVASRKPKFAVSYNEVIVSYGK